jgi:hypothetical protein
MKNEQIIAEIEEYSKDITRLLVQIVCEKPAGGGLAHIACQQAKDLTLDSFEDWEKTKLHKLRNVIEGKNSKPDKAKEITR